MGMGKTVRPNFVSKFGRPVTIWGYAVSCFIRVCLGELQSVVSPKCVCKFVTGHHCSCYFLACPSSKACSKFCLLLAIVWSKKWTSFRANLSCCARRVTTIWLPATGLTWSVNRILTSPPPVNNTTVFLGRRPGTDVHNEPISCGLRPARWSCPYDNASSVRVPPEGRDRVTNYTGRGTGCDRETFCEGWTWTRGDTASCGLQVRDR